MNEGEEKRKRKKRKRKKNNKQRMENKMEEGNLKKWMRNENCRK